jgi:multidrug efflux pump subunit AcrB
MEKLFLEKLTPLLTNGLEVAIKSEQNGPPTGSPVSIKLLASETDQLSDLKKVVRDFELYLKELPGTKNVNNTSQDSPGEIVMSIYRDRVAAAGLSPLQIYSEISNVVRGVKAGSVTLDDEDIDIIVKSDAHYDNLDIDQILSQILQTQNGPITIASLVKYEFRNALVEVRRVDSDLTISVESDVRDRYKAADLLLALNNFAASYSFPEGITYKK